MTEITDIDFDPPKVDPRDERIAELEADIRHLREYNDQLRAQLGYQQASQDYYNRSQSLASQAAQQQNCNPYTPF